MQPAHTRSREEVWETVASFLQREFGRLLEVRDVRRIRRVVGEGWSVTIVLTATTGDIHVADVSVDEKGTITPVVDANAVVLAIKRSLESRSPSLPPAVADDMGDMGEFASDDGSDALDALDVADPIDVRAAAAIARGDAASLREARELLPRMLTDHDKRGTTLLTMAEVETKLGEPSLAKGYLEAAARELGDRFDMPSLERCAAVALDLLGKEAFTTSPIHALLEESRARLKPIADIFESKTFAGMPEALRAQIEQSLVFRTLAPGEDLVREGEPSKNVFVVRSGLLGVWLEKPSGGQWMVRCCFPGWLLGESSVLTDLASNARCTATLRA